MAADKRLTNTGYAICHSGASSKMPNFIICVQRAARSRLYFVTAINYEPKLAIDLNNERRKILFPAASVGFAF